jgi:hypothetical protein
MRLAIPDGNVFKTIGGAGDVDGVALSVATFRSLAIRIEAVARVSVQVVWTGDPTGTFTLQVSNKVKPDDATDTDWLTWTPGTAIVNPAATASQTLLVFDDARGAPCPCRWARVKLVVASVTVASKLSGFVAGKQ